MDKKITITPEFRIAQIQKYLSGHFTVARICRDAKISRMTFYRWLNTYQNNGKDITALQPKPRFIPSKKEKITSEHESLVLSIAKQTPLASKYEISAKISASVPNFSISPSGVYKVLANQGIGNLDCRLNWAGYAPVSQIVEEPGSVSYVSVWLKPLLASFIISLAVFVSALKWIDILAGGSIANFLGVTFAVISLVFGFIFFLYSLKYYTTMIMILSYAQKAGITSPYRRPHGLKSFLTRLISGNQTVETDFTDNNAKSVGLIPNLDHVVLDRHPFISVQIPFYNEKNVVERSIRAATSFDYPGDYEVIACDDSTDATTQIIDDYISTNSLNATYSKSQGDGWTLVLGEVRPGVTLKHIHRTTRSGFKGGALALALRLSDPRTEFVSIFDADFVPYTDSLVLFLKYFKESTGTVDFRQSSVTNIAAVQGYQWHVLNKSENWITRGVRSEYAGSYVIERSGTELYGGLKQISGSVYMIRKDVLQKIGWGTSITEDFELTLKLYAQGYKVLYTPYIQAPSECVSTVKRLIRQRMRWAEGHSFNIKKNFTSLMFGRWEWVDKKRKFIPSPLSLSEKAEVLYLSPYYLQAAFFLLGTFAWFISETVFPARLPFWTALWGWSLVLTNIIALPLMNAVGMFMEESEEKDYLGLTSFIALSYLVVPFQAYAAIKGFLEKAEGPWFRTPKTGRITDNLLRTKLSRFIQGILPGKISELQLMTKPSSVYLSTNFAFDYDVTSIFDRKRNKKIARAALSFVIMAVVLLNSFVGVVKPLIAAAPDPTIEQQVNITDQTYNTTLGSADLADRVSQTPNVAKRNAPGPFYVAPIIQGDPNNASALTDDVVSFSRGSQFGGNFYANLDTDQGSIVLWWTPEYSYNSLSGTGFHYIYYLNSTNYLRYEYDNDRFGLMVGNQSMTVSSNIVAGTAYNLVVRWDTRNVIQGSNYVSFSIDDSQSYGITAQPTQSTPAANIYIGSDGTTGASSSIIEGFTVYRRVLYDGTNGINAGNGDELNLIYNSGTGTDPTNVTGSWDIVFAFPTSQVPGALGTTGEAWTHPYSSNLLGNGGLMLNGTYTSDGWVSQQTLTLQPDATAGVDTYVNAASAGTNYATDVELPIRGDSALTSLLKFDLSSIPAGSTINSATLYLYASSINTTRTDNVYRVLSADSAWTEAGATWNYAVASTTRWAGDTGNDGGSDAGASVSGTDFASTSMGSWSATAGASANTEYAITLGTTEFTSMLSANYGIELRSENSDFNNNTYNSSDYATAAYRPKLVVTYTPVTTAALASSEKIYSGGYKITSGGAANQGIYKDITVTAGDDWVVRGIANSDGTCVPKLILYNQTGSAEIGSLTGASTSTRVSPDVLLLSGEAQTSETTLRVKLINTASSGTCYWHQVEVLSNLITNPSYASGTGDPWIPTGYSDRTGGGTPAGRALQDTTNYHSGGSSLRFSFAAGWNDYIYDLFDIPKTAEAYYSTGIYMRYDATGGNTSRGWVSDYDPYWATQADNNISCTDCWHSTQATTSSSWSKNFEVLRGRPGGSTGTMRLNVMGDDSGGGNYDDAFLFQLTDVSISIVPASKFNSNEVNGLRVDGRDIDTQQISNLTTTQGVFTFKYTPRHSAADAVKFIDVDGNSEAWIAELYANATNTIQLYWNAANTITLRYCMNSTCSSSTWDATGAVSAGTTYTVQINYTGGSTMTLKVDGSTKITLSSIPAAFASTPSMVYWGSRQTGDRQGDGAFNQIYDSSQSNPLGTIYWVGSKYSGASIYFEAVIQCVSCSGGNARASAGLYDSGNNLVSGSNITTTNGSYTRVRSSSLTLTDSTNYSAQLTRDATSGTAYLRSARLIIIQTNPSAITNTQTQVEVGNFELNSSTSYVPLSDKKIYLYTSASFNPSPTVYFEATLSSDTAGQTSYAALYTDGSSCSSVVSGSEVTSTGTTWTRVRSSAVTLSNATSYMVCVKGSANVARIASAKIILEQSGYVSAVEIYHQELNTMNTDTSTSYISQNYQNQFDPSNFYGGTFTYLYEATIKTTAGSYYSQLYNRTTSAAVSSSEQTATDVTYTRKRSASLSMPGSASLMDTQIKNSVSGNTTSVSSSWLIIQVSSLQVPENSLLFVPLALIVPLIIRKKIIVNNAVSA